MARSRSHGLFAELSGQLEVLAPNLAGLVACPLCLRLYSKSDYEAGRLTNGHVVPKALGAKRFTLLCAQCNGHCAKHDNHLVEYVRVMFGARPGAKVKAVEIEVDGQTVTGSLRRNAPGARDPYTISIVPVAGDISALKREPQSTYAPTETSESSSSGDFITSWLISRC